VWIGATLVLQDAIESSGPNWTGKSLVLTSWERKARKPQVCEKGEPGPVAKQVFWNILENAVKNSRPKGWGKS